jgi:hypothetical protein
MIPAIIRPMMWGIRNLLSKMGANKIIASTIKNIRTGFSMGKVNIPSNIPDRS